MEFIQQIQKQIEFHNQLERERADAKDYQGAMYHSIRRGALEDLVTWKVTQTHKKEENGFTKFNYSLLLEGEEHKIDPPENFKENPLAEKLKLIPYSKGNKVTNDLFEDYKDFKALREESKLNGVWLDEDTEINKDQMDRLKQSQINKIEVVDVEEVSSGNYTMTISDSFKPGDEVKVGLDENGVPKTLEVKKPKKEKEYSPEVHKCVADCIPYFEGDLKPTMKDLPSWLDTADKLNRLDGLSFDDVVVLTKAARGDKFWKKNFLSLVKLRRKDKDKIPYWKVFKEKFSVSETKSKKIFSAYEEAMKNLE